MGYTFKCNTDINKNNAHQVAEELRKLIREDNNYTDMKPFVIGSCKNCVHDGVCKYQELAEHLKIEHERYIFNTCLVENPLKMECKYFQNNKIYR